MAEYAYQKHTPKNWNGSCWDSYTPMIWNGSAWVEYPANIYSEKTDLDLLNNDAVTGGWVGTNRYYGASTKAPTITTSDGIMTVKTVEVYGNGGSGSAETANAIDVTNYKTLTVTITGFTSTVDWEGDIGSYYVGLTDDLDGTATTSNVANNFVAYRKITSTAAGTYTIDISGVTGEVKPLIVSVAPDTNGSRETNTMSISISDMKWE